MILHPGELLSRLTGRLPVPGGRPQWRRWAGHGRAHIEVKGVHRRGFEDVAHQVETELVRLRGVDWAQVNAVLGRVIVAFDDSVIGVGDLVGVIEGVEEANGLAAERFPHQRPDHPADIEALQRHLYAAGADIAGLGLDETAQQTLTGAAGRLARRGYRMLAVAEREASGRRDLHEDRVGRLEFAGLLAFTDPVRDTAARAIRGLLAAGVNVIMITGDHPSTAESVAGKLGLTNGRRVLTGPDLDLLSDAELDGLLPQVGAFARVSPDNKVRIVAALRRTGHVVAVTGDGANDAPAIKLADAGIALGLRGTNAAKEAADVVVTDDRIETIIDAIVEGRAMWASVRDAISMLLGGNLGEIAFTVGTGLLLPSGSPLNARQLLLVNLFTDLVPSMTLSARPPAGITPERLLAEGPDVSLAAPLTRDVIVRGVLTAAAGTAAWGGGHLTGVSPRRTGTIALIGLVGAQLGQTMLAGWRSPLVVASSLGSAGALAAVIQTPGISQFFGCRPVGPTGWAIGLTTATAATAAVPLTSRLVTVTVPLTMHLPELLRRPVTDRAPQACWRKNALGQLTQQALLR